MDTEGILGKKNMIINIAVAMVAVIIAVNIYGAQVKKTNELRARRDIEQRKNEILAQINQVHSQLLSYNNFFLDNAEGMMNEVNELARAENIEIISIRPSIIEKQVMWIRYPLQLQVVAPDFHALGSFISKLESQPQVYVVSDVIMRSKQREFEKGLDVEQRELKKGLDVDLTVSGFAKNSEAAEEQNEQ